MNCGGVTVWPWGEVQVDTDAAEYHIDANFINEKTTVTCPDCGATVTLTPIQVTNCFDGYKVTFKNGDYDWNNHEQDWACGGADCQGLKISPENVITENGNTHKLSEITEDTIYVCSTCNGSMKIHKEEKNGTVTIGAKSDTNWMFRNGPITINAYSSDKSEGALLAVDEQPLIITAESDYIITSVKMTITDVEGAVTFSVDNGTLPESFTVKVGAQIEIKDINAQTLTITPELTTGSYGIYDMCNAKDFVVTYQKPHVHNSDEYGHDADQHWTKCTDDDDNDGTHENHTWSNGVCTVCKYACVHDGTTSKVDGNTYTRNCKHNCGIPASSATLNASDMKYTGQPYDGASYSFSNWNLPLEPGIMYAGTGDTVYEASADAPTEPGTYVAMAILGSTNPLFQVEFKIEKAGPSAGVIVASVAGGTVVAAIALYAVAFFLWSQKNIVLLPFLKTSFEFVAKNVFKKAVTSAAAGAAEATATGAAATEAVATEATVEAATEAATETATEAATETAVDATAAGAVASEEAASESEEDKQ